MMRSQNKRVDQIGITIRAGRVRNTRNQNRRPVRIGDLQSSIPWHAVFVFLIPVLVEVLQMHCQGSNKSPMETHLPNMLSLIFAILLYCSALGYHIKSRLHLSCSSSINLNVSSQVAFISAFLACASIISVMVPHPFGLHVFILWIIIVVVYVAMNNPILPISKKLYHISNNAISHVYFNIRKRITGSNKTTV